MKETWGDADLVRLWAFGGGSESSADKWREGHDLGDTPILIDTDSSIQRAYFAASGSEDAFAQNPRHILIDHEGLLRFMGTNLSPEDEDAAIQAALDATE